MRRIIVKGNDLGEGWTYEWSANPLPKDIIIPGINYKSHYTENFYLSEEAYQYLEKLIIIRTAKKQGFRNCVNSVEVVWNDPIPCSPFSEK